MHNDQSPGGESLLNMVHRVESALTNINVRIARLSMSLDASLATEEDIVKILNRQTPSFREHAREHAADILHQSEHRELNQWEELRGLLVLRSELMTHSLNDLGLEVTQEIALHIEAQLERGGFKPGTDGVDLHRLNP